MKKLHISADLWLPLDFVTQTQAILAITSRGEELHGQRGGRGTPAGGDPIARDHLDEITGYKRSSRDAYIQRLTARRIVEAVGRGEVKASKELF